MNAHLFSIKDMILPDKKLLEVVEIDIGFFYYYTDCIISEVNTGVVIAYENLKPVFLNAQKHYGNDIPFYYISNRIHSYSIVLTSHFRIRSIFPNFKAYGIVSYNKQTHKVAELEKVFFNRPIHIFNSLDVAISWGDAILAQF